MNRQQQWIRPPKNLTVCQPYIRARLLRPIDNNYLEFQLPTERGLVKVTVPIECSFSTGQGKDYEDMCEMDVLNQPQVLSNLIKRYNQQKIFTCIGPTLIVINPYKFIDNLFGNQVLSKAKQTTLAGKSTQSLPHLYKVAGQAFQAITAGKGKQAIVISGQSGAGKTQSTKYCVQLLTTLGPVKAHSIEQRILAANPVLQAFGNSKTIRNENSSRFGKYMSIFFDQKGHILGAKINNYLLQKSRVVNISKNERSFHAFYALTASGKWNIKPANQYRTLRQSGCYTSTHTNDAQYYQKINSAFKQIGFKSEETDKVWSIIAAILQLGNIQFDERLHLIDQSRPCTLVGVKQLGNIAKLLGTDANQLQNILLFEKRRFLKQYTFMPYGKASCIANQEALCKALYQSLFQFILQGVQAHLQPKQPVVEGLQISILDIFGFENFGQNSFEQFCINFANQKLLRLYNDYVFRKQLDILRQDGLQEQTVGLVPPSNNTLINLMSGKLSLFSIINDMTLPQFKDSDVIHSFHSLQSPQIFFDKLNPHIFALSHSPCDVSYSIDGFKVKNQDKIHQDISDLLEKLWSTKESSTGKTILSKFNKQMDDLMNELQSSHVYFIRCIKPNELKKSNNPDQNYILTQIRYLGVLQTIFIRKNTFPARKTYKAFKNEYGIVFRALSKEGKQQNIIKQIMNEIQAKSDEFLLGKVRVYMTTELQQRLDKLLYECMKIREEKSKKIQKQIKVWLFRTKILRKLKIFSNRLKMLKQIPQKIESKIKLKFFISLKQLSEIIRIKKAKEEQQAKLAMLKQAKEIRQKQKLRHKHIQQSKIHDDLNESQIGLYQQNPNDQSESLSGVREAFKNMIPLQKPNLLANGLMSLMLNQTDQVSNRPIDPRMPYNKPQTPSAGLMGQNLSFNSQFRKLMDNKSEAQFQSPGVLFERQIDPGIYNGTEKQLNKLKSILSQKYKVDIKGNQEDFFSPMSSHCNFKMADLPSTFLSQIIDYQVEDYFNRILRKRTTFFGSKKTYNQILVCKKAPLSKSMTVLSSQQDQKRAIEIFNSVIKIGEEQNINKVLKYVQSFLEQCQNSSLELKQQIIVQMLRQSNTNYELSAIRIYQLMTVYLHVYNPPMQILKAALNIYYWKIKDKKMPNTEYSYLVYLFSCIARKIQKRVSIGYLPYSYQIMGLMCKRQISIPIYLPAGTSILVSIESYHTFGDIKGQCLKQFGISDRLNLDLFGFFEVVNFESQDLQQTPIRQTNSIWDMITYWQLTKQKYNQGGIAPPTFFIIVKLRFAVVIKQEDQELTQLCFSQLYYQYFMGRLEYEAHFMYVLAALIFKIKHSDKKLDDMVMGLLPLNFSKQLKKSSISIKVKLAIDQLQQTKMNERQMKYKFITICAQNQLALAIEIPVQEQFKLFVKPRQIFIKTQEKIEVIPLKRLIRWQINKQSLILEVAPNKGETTTKQYTIKTDNASIFNEMLRCLSTQKLGGNQMNRVASFRKK